MKNHLYILLLLLAMSFQGFGQEFVQVKDQQLILKGKAYHFIGTNFWYGMNLGGGNEHDRERLKNELDQLQNLGITNLRIMAASEGPEDSPYQNKPILQTAPGKYNQELLEGLDYLLVEMNRRDMKAVVCLGNFWMWSGGFPQYISWVENSDIPYPDIAGGSSWNEFIAYSQSFYKNKEAIQLYHDFLQSIIGRKNSLSGVDYKNDPTIMAWQLANEPRGYNNVWKYRKWIRKSAKLIQQMDTNHLVSLGAEGDTSTKLSGTDLYKDSKSKHIDYATTHLWIQNWGWYDPNDTTTYARAKSLARKYLDNQVRKAKKLNKPLVLEEFGVPRDGGAFEEYTSASFRDDFYQWVFSYTVEQIKANGPLNGCNFWSWGGTGRPNQPGGFWQFNDDLIGDPAHELQGWYSVYDSDESTLDIIKKYTEDLGQ